MPSNYHIQATNTSSASVRLGIDPFAEFSWAEVTAVPELSVAEAGSASARASWRPSLKKAVAGGGGAAQFDRLAPLSGHGVASLYARRKAATEGNYFRRLEEAHASRALERKRLIEDLKAEMHANLRGNPKTWRYGSVKQARQYAALGKSVSKSLSAGNGVARVSEGLFTDLGLHSDTALFGVTSSGRLQGKTSMLYCACCGGGFGLFWKRSVLLSNRQARLCETCDTPEAIITSNGQVFANRAKAEESGLKLYSVFDRTGRKQEEAWHQSLSSYGSTFGVISTDVAQSLNLDSSDGVAVLYDPVLPYHSGIGRDFLGSTCGSSTNVGIELEWNAGGNDRQDKLDLAANITVLSRGKIIVERDSSVSGFEAITGYGSPDKLREILMPMYLPAMQQNTLSKLRTSLRTGLHVHASLGDDEESAHKRLKSILKTESWRQYGYHHEPASTAEAHYIALAGRPWNSYAHRAYTTSHRAAVGVRTNTVEFRLFRNTSKLPHILACSQWCYALVRFAKEGGVNDAYDTHFVEFVNSLPLSCSLELRAWLVRQYPDMAPKVDYNPKMAAPYYGRRKV